MKMLVTVEDLTVDADDLAKFLASVEGSHFMRDVVSQAAQRAYDRLKAENMVAAPHPTVAAGLTHPTPAELEAARVGAAQPVSVPPRPPSAPSTTPRTKSDKED